MQYLHKLICYLLLLLFISLPACQQTPSESVNASPAAAAQPAPPMTLTQAHRIAKNFAEAFHPVDLGAIRALWEVPDSIATAFRTLRADSAAQEKYLTLVYITLYAQHLRCCHQSYDVHRSTQLDRALKLDSVGDPLLFEFNHHTHNLYIKEYRHSIEMVSSGVVADWVERRPYLLAEPQIRVQWDIIQAVGDSIEKGLYWPNVPPESAD